ncbi:MAG: XRE family transcriptional regulator [Bacteroidales bacterium]|jgi:plasmid maintenance system antidote protein VapI|nr:XRE family transcriptional regulator [Bacteroidales bacterium]
MLQQDIHIGILIKNKFREDGRSASCLAEKIHCRRDNIYDIFGRVSIDTALLLSISLALETNFFEYFHEKYKITITKIENT